ncbi:hypothetical protein [Amycolatopsis japonica]
MSSTPSPPRTTMAFLCTNSRDRVDDTRDWTDDTRIPGGAVVHAPDGNLVGLIHNSHFKAE